MRLKKFPSLTAYVSIYSTQGIENDVSARLPNITAASCDLDLLTSRSTDHGGRFMLICIEMGSFIFEI